MPTDPATPPERPRLTLLGASVTRGFATRDLGDGQPVLSGEVRPAMPREVSAFIKRQTDAKPGDEDKVRADFYARHIKEWDAAGADGAPAPVTADNVLALPYPIWVQLENVVLGFAGSAVAGKPDGSP